MEELVFEIINASSDEHAVLLYGVTKEGQRVIARDESTPLYFLLLLEDKADIESLIFQINGLTAIEGSVKCGVLKTVHEKKKLLGEDKNFLKVYVNNTKALKLLSERVKLLEGVDKSFEKEINHAKKYLFDKHITPLKPVRIKGKKLTNPPSVEYYYEIEEINNIEEESSDHNLLCFDIETYNPRGVSEQTKDPILMISYSTNTGRKGVLTWKKTRNKTAKILENEKEMLETFTQIIKEEKPAFIITYNGDNFDFPYIKERCRLNKVKLNIGWDGSSVNFTNRGIRGSSARINGLVHLDLYPFIATSMGTYLKTDTYTLNAVCEELLGESKEDFNITELAGLWDKGDIEKPIAYSLKDAEVTLKLANKILPLLFELTRIVGVLPENICRTGFSKLVENYLMKETRNFNEIILRQPGKEEITQRMRQSFKGGFVYEPKPGFYENIAVFDFRSLYPSIIVAHNVCPTTLNAKGKDVHVSPKIIYNNKEVSFRFAKLPTGFIPSLIKGLIERRANIKTIINKLDKHDPDYNILSARQNAIKILANATYGYLGFPQARWYSNECAASITAWGRQYINNVLKSAESSGLKVLYGDTDSCFFILPSPDSQTAKKFVSKVNKNLPDVMSLQFEGLFKTGIFVSKKTEKKGAKKKYALCSDKNELTVKGFELVRRDWSTLSKKLQEKILREVLIKKDFKAGLKALHDTIIKVRKGEIKLQDFVIKTRLTKDIRNYENIGPHVSAVMRAEKNGKTIVTGMLVEYVIIKGTGKISEKAYMIEEAVEKNLQPDYDYYINNQIIPSVEEILKTIGYTEEDINKTEQQTLQGYM